MELRVLQLLHAGVIVAGNKRVCAEMLGQEAEAEECSYKKGEKLTRIS